MILEALYVCWESFFRRLWGGGWSNTPIIKYRSVQGIMNFLATFGILWYKDTDLWQNIVVCSFLCVLWAMAVGPAIDEGRDNPPSDKILARYKKPFWNAWCEFLVPKSSWYGYFYDFLWMFFRYEIPALPIALFLWSPWFLMAGFGCSFAYTIGWACYDHKILSRLAGSEIAEYLSGFIVGLLLVL